jgi:Flp pilus assembly pilin Flp
MRSTILRLLRDEGGQDLVEYALLTTVVALAGAVSIDLISASINNAYGVFDTSINNLWVPNDPSGGGS